MPPKRINPAAASRPAPYPDVPQPASRRPRNTASTARLATNSAPAMPSVPATNSAPVLPIVHDPTPIQYTGLIDDLRIEFRQNINDSFNQVMERLESLIPAQPNVSTVPASTVPASIIMPHLPVAPLVAQPPPHPIDRQPALLSGNPPDPPAALHDVLALWPWVDTTTITAIAAGRFDITSLPKLFRDESIRTRLAAKEVEGWNAPVQGGEVKLVMGRTKFHTAFKDLSSFLSAWLVYCSIRSTYSPERGPGLAAWTERIVGYASSTVPWSAVLNYAIAYFRAHQNAPTATWHLSDSELVSDYLALAHTQPIVSKISTAKAKSQAQQICNNYNRPIDACKNGNNCSRQHVCKICLNKEHRAPDCPLKASSASR